MEGALQKIFKKGNVIVSGDFNVHFGTKSTNEKNLTDLMSSYGFLATISSNKRGDKCLDNIFINYFQHSHDYITDTINYGLSDHLSQKIEVQLPIFSELEEVVIHRPVTQEGRNKFFQLVSEKDFHFISSEDVSVEHKFQVFHDLLHAAYIAAFPLKYKKVIKKKSILNLRKANGSLLNLRRCVRSIKFSIFFQEKILHHNASPSRSNIGKSTEPPLLKLGLWLTIEKSHITHVLPR